MKLLSTLIADPQDDVALRITGRSMDEWAAEWSRRRSSGLRTKRLNGHQLHTVDERESAIRFYDLELEDFEAVLARVSGAPVEIPYELRDLPVVQLDFEAGDRMAAQHAAAATASQPPLKAAIMFRITQPALRRIAQEARHQ